MMRRFLVLALFVSAIGFTASAGAAQTCPVPVFGPGRDYHPTIDPALFSANVTNPWFPLPPGVTYVYSGTKDGQQAIDLFHPTDRTKIIDGVQTRVVEDRLLLDGVLEERTFDYYSQDACGNVWYFGEDTAELDRHGHVTNTDGSFHAGIDGAEPGVYMQADPTLHTKFRQEWYRGQAEDVFRAVDLSARVRVPYGKFSGALRTEEFTRLEPRVLDNKVYVRGLGEVVETAVKGPVETLELVAVL